MPSARRAAAMARLEPAAQRWAPAVPVPAAQGSADLVEVDCWAAALAAWVPALALALHQVGRHRTMRFHHHKRKFPARCR